MLDKIHNKHFILFSIFFTLVVFLVLIFLIIESNDLKSEFYDEGADSSHLPVGLQEDMPDLEETRAGSILEPYMLAEPFVPSDKSFFDNKNREFKLENYKGNLVILYFWASWCANCIQEMKELQHLHAELEFHKIHDLEIIPLSVDKKEVFEFNEYYESAGLDTMPIFHDFERQLAQEFKVKTLPAAFIINKEGQVIAHVHDHIHWNSEQLSHEILQLKGDDQSHLDFRHIYHK